jgi:diguanylate cyclase (GGDEF)-like protein
MPEGEDRKRAVLVVDDDETVRRLLGSMLANDYRVLLAGSGAEAVRILEVEEVDAVLADQMMPEMSGVELLAKTLHLRPSAVRILVTASERIEHAKDAINVARVRRFLSKPVRINELREIIAGALREGDLERENERLIGELQEKNALLQKALSLVQEQERVLEQKVEERTRELKEAMAKLSELALRDGLTGLYNHRYFQEALTTELARSARHSHQCGLIFIDVDHFKNYNDIAGHQAGDGLLRQLARILVNTGELAEVRIRGRVSDIAARYGGEEFVIILPETDKAGAMVRAERLRASISEYRFAQAEVQPGGCVTVSIGVSTYPEDGLSKQAIVEAADRALRQAKRDGRNKVVAA